MFIIYSAFLICILSIRFIVFISINLSCIGNFVRRGDFFLIARVANMLTSLSRGWTSFRGARPCTRIWSQMRPYLNLWSTECQELCQRQHSTGHRWRTHTLSQDRDWTPKHLRESNPSRAQWSKIHILVE